MKKLRYALLLACLTVLGAVGACSDGNTGRNANPAGPSLDCGGYLGGGGGRQDTTNICQNSAPPPADTL
jgi:hypothetical protein